MGKSTTSKAHVYLFYNPPGFTKIGVAKNVYKRLSYIQSASPFEIFVLGAVEVGRPYELENYLHKQYEGYRYRGEWFKFEPEKIREVLAFLELPVPDISTAAEKFGVDMSEVYKNGYEPYVPIAKQWISRRQPGLHKTHR